MKYQMSIFLSILIFLTACQTNEVTSSNNLAYAVAWKKTAAEYRALYYQGFNIARQRVDEFVNSPINGLGKPLAIISDLDDTLILSDPYWSYLIKHDLEFFDDSVWDEWVASDQATPSPGALEFLNFCEENNISVFYVTNRNQGDNTREYLVNTLNRLDFPSVDDDHLFVLQESSNKELIQNQIKDDYEVIVMLGDNLNDFSREYYVSDIGERYSLVENNSEKYGSDFILFPNPTDGHWIRAIFGESEPAPTIDNKMLMREAASNSAWRD